MSENIFVRILKYGLYLVALIPLVIFNDFISPFHFGKVIVFRSILEILLVFYLILIWRDRRYLPPTNNIHWSFLFFTLAFGLTTLTETPASTRPLLGGWKR